MTLRLILVDDQEMYRLGFRMLLETQEGVEVVGEAEDGRAAVDLIERVEADIVLMDVRMPRMNGIEATRTITRGGAGGPRVIVLTTFDLDEYAYEAIRAGASGFLLKDASLEELMAAIHHVHGGDAVMAPSTTRRLIEHFALPPPVVDDGDDRFRALEDLTAREREVLARVAAYPETLIFYEAPHRLRETLDALAESLGRARQACAARELTKKFEELRRATLGELLAHYREHEPRGEFVLVVAGADETAAANDGEEMSLIEHYTAHIAAGLDKKEAMRRTAQELGISRRDVYQAVLAGER